MTKFGNKISIIVVVAILLVVSFWVFKSSQTVTEKLLITNFEECANAGYPVMESYPRQCRVPGGELFVETVNIPPGETPIVKGGCFVGGCSGQICSDQKDAVSTCEYREEYACYKTATCERDTSGQCGWTETPMLLACLNPTTNRSGYVAGHVTIGPFCPVEREDQPCQTPPEAYSSRSVIIYKSDGVTIKEKGKIDGQGNYKINLDPGKYFVQIDPAGIGPGEKKPLTVKSLETTVVDFNIDTGIR